MIHDTWLLDPVDIGIFRSYWEPVHSTAAIFFNPGGFKAFVAELKCERITRQTDADFAGALAGMLSSATHVMRIAIPFDPDKPETMTALTALADTFGQAAKGEVRLSHIYRHHESRTERRTLNLTTLVFETAADAVLAKMLMRTAKTGNSDGLSVSRLVNRRWNILAGTTGTS